MEFTLNPEYFTSITVYKEWNTYTKGGRVPTPEELGLILAGKGKCSMSYADDHPEFAKLREHLDHLGYISIFRGVWNCDQVLKAFTLNGRKFNAGEKFACASAMGVEFKIRASHPKY